MTVYRGHIWYETARMRGLVLVGWQIIGGPHDGSVIVALPGDVVPLRVVSGDDWYSDRRSAELDVARKFRALGCDEKAAQIEEAY